MRGRQHGVGPFHGGHHNGRHSALHTGVNARNACNIALMRPINSMIEFKQIIGHGTRLFEGKDDFTIDDSLRA
jgi:type I site-specific restriction endonuclease